MENIKLELFISGEDRTSEVALDQAREICDALADQARLEVVDTEQDPTRTAMAEVWVTPTLVLSKPAPERRVVGDFGDRNAVLRALHLDQAGS